MRKFKVGDKVRCITHLQEPYFIKGEEILIEGIQCGSIYGRGEFRYDSRSWYIHFDQVELVESAEKSRVKEIEVYVEGYSLGVKEALGCGTGLKCFQTKQSNWEEGDYYKAKLIVELPEKKVELSESEFEEIFEKVKGRFRKNMDIKEDLKREIFGNE